MATELEKYDGRRFYRVNGGLMGMAPDLRKAMDTAYNWMREVDGRKCLPVGYVSVRFRAELMERLIDLEGTLSGGPDDEIVEAVGWLFKAFPASSSAGSMTVSDAAKRAKDYVEILRELPGWAVSSSVRKFALGEGGEGPAKFCPSPAEIAHGARQNTKLNSDERLRIKGLVDAPVSERVPGPWWVNVRPEDRDRVGRARTGMPDAQGIGKDNKTKEQRAETADRITAPFWASNKALPQERAEEARKLAAIKARYISTGGKAGEEARARMLEEEIKRTAEAKTMPTEEPTEEEAAPWVPPPPPRVDPLSHVSATYTPKSPEEKALIDKAEDMRKRSLKAQGYDENSMMSPEWLKWQAEDKRLRGLEEEERKLEEEEKTQQAEQARSLRDSFDPPDDDEDIKL